MAPPLLSTRLQQFGIGGALCLVLLYAIVAGSPTAYLIFVLGGIAVAIHTRRTLKAWIATAIAAGATERSRRREAVIEKYVNRAINERDTYRRRRLEALLEECMREIISMEWRLGPAPKYGEWLQDWQRRANSDALNLQHGIEQRMRDAVREAQEREFAIKQAADERECDRLAEKHQDLINKFLEIAERKVSVLDDYGDERWELLPKEIDACIIKIAGREGLREEHVRESLKKGYDFNLPKPLRPIRAKLRELFGNYHEQQKLRLTPKDEVGSLTGSEFETYVARSLVKGGFSVTATPVTGDQGADLIATKNGRKIIIQVKRYAGSVGNGAVQEVVAAVRYYDGTEGCVVTNSTFTPGARALAQKNNVKLIDGSQLDRLSEL